GIRPDGRLGLGGCPAPRKIVKHGNARQNHETSARRTLQVVGEGVVKKRRGSQHKQRWNYRIPPHALRSLGERLAAPENEERDACDHVEHPLRENRQLFFNDTTTPE